MTVLAAYARDDLALLAADNLVRSRAMQADRPVGRWPVIEVAPLTKLWWHSEGWRAFTGSGPWLSRIAASIDHLGFTDLPAAIQRRAEDDMRALEAANHQIAAYTREFSTWWLVGQRDQTVEAVVLDWRGAERWRPWQRLAVGYPPEMAADDLQPNTDQCNSELEHASPAEAVRAVARLVGAARQCGAIVGDIEMGLMVREGHEWTMARVPLAPWHLIERGDVRAQRVTGPGVIRIEPPE